MVEWSVKVVLKERQPVYVEAQVGELAVKAVIPTLLVPIGDKAMEEDKASHGSWRWPSEEEPKYMTVWR